MKKMIAVVLLFAGTVFSNQPVQIVSAMPQGQITGFADVQAITVVFNQPMIALQATPTDQSDGPFSLQPLVKGRYRWTGTRNLTFIPDMPLVAATRYTVTIPVGVKSVSGDELASPYVWNFETPRPRLLDSRPKHNTTGMSLNQAFSLRFNQPMDLTRINGRIYLLDGTVNLPVDFSNPSQDESDQYFSDHASHIIKVTPRKPLKMDRTVTLVIAKDLLAAQGDLGMAETKRLTFSTFGPLKFVQYTSSDNTKEMLPGTGVRFWFTNPVKYSELAKNLQFKPAVQIPEEYQSRTWSDSDVWFELALEPETDYEFTIGANLTDIYGNSLGTPVTQSLTTLSYPSRVALSIGPGVLEAYSDRRYPVFFTNADTVNLRMGMVAPNQLIPLLLDENIWNESVQLPANLFMVDRSWVVKNPRNVKCARPMEMDWLLAGRKNGLVLAEIDNWYGEEEQRYQRILLQVTHMGVSAKFSAINNVIWVTNLQDGSPVVDARVEIRDNANNVLWTGKTDTQGIAESPGWRELKITRNNRWDTPRQWVFVYKDLDTAYLSSEMGWGIEPYRFDIAYEWNPQPIKEEGLLFTDRNIYRAGETVYLKGIMREKKFSEWEPPSIKSVRVRVVDSRGAAILTDTLSVNNYGSIHFDLALDESAPLGYYEAVAESLTATDEYNGRIMSTSFRVEAFRPAEFSVTLVPEKESVLLGDQANVFVAAAYLFGGAMARQEITWQANMSKTEYQPPGYDDWMFGRPWWTDDEQGYSSTNLGQGKDSLDAKGQYRLSAEAKAAGIDRPQMLVMSADVKSQSNQVIGSSVSIRVDPADFYIGLKLNTTFTEVNKPINYQLVTVAPDGKPQPNRTVKVSIVQRQWHSVRKAGVEGRYEWISRHEDTTIESAQLVGQATPVSGSFTMKNAGYYLLIAEGQDPAGRMTLSEVSLYVTGSGYVAWERRDDDRIELVANSRRYRPGDVAKIMIKSPFEKARGLVTLEREGVMWQQAVDLVGSTPTIEIPITEKYLPNVFVSVMLIQGRTSNFVFSEEGEDVGRPTFKIGYVSLNVDPGSKHLVMKVKSDKEEYRPGETATVSIDVTDSQGKPCAAEVTLAVVDRGILNLTNYQLPDPFNDFYALRSLSVQTSETRLHVVEQRNYGEKGEKRGGGGADFGNSDADLRKNFKSAAYWNPALQVDATGKAQVAFQLPDNLTSFKMMAVGQTLKAEFGAVNSDFRVKLPLLLQPALPRFARKGDAFEAGIVVHNYSGKKGKGIVEVEASGITLKGANKLEFELEHGDSRIVLFPFQATQIGNAVFRFRCRMNELSDGLEKTIPVQVPSLHETVATYKRVEESVKEKLQPPTDVYTDMTQVEITAASTAMSEFSGAVNYLMSYPYDCLEQRVSKALPVIISADLVKAFDLPTNLNEGYEDMVRRILKEMPKFQKDDGGFGIWPTGTYSSPYTSAYAVYAMSLAKKAGYSVNQEVMGRGLDYLRSVLSGDVSRSNYPYDDLSWKATDAFILYVLALNNRTDAGYVEKMTMRVSDLPLTAQTYLLRTAQLLLTQPQANSSLISQMRKQLTRAGEKINPLQVRKEELVQGIMNHLRTDPTTAYFEDQAGDMAWIYHSNVRSSAMCLQAILEAGADLPMSENVIKWLLQQRKNGHWSNTQENFYVLHALSTYFERYEKVEPNFETQIKLAGQQALSYLFAGRSRHVERKVLPIASLGAKPIDVEINKKGSGSLYYGLRMTYYPLQTKDPRDEGLTVLKSVMPVQAQFGADGSYPIGQIFRITLTVETPHDRYYVVVDDPVPAGLEPINVSLATTSAAVAEMEGESENSWWRGFNHVEKHDDRVLLFADYLQDGVTTFSYLARATTKGVFQLPPTHAEEMYTPEVYGRTVSKVVTVK